MPRKKFFRSPYAAEGPGKLSKAEQDGEEFVVDELLPVSRCSVPNLDQGHDHGGEQENSLQVRVRILQRIFIASEK